MLRSAHPFRGMLRLAGLTRLARPEAGRCLSTDAWPGPGVREACHRGQRFVGRARQLSLDLGERSSLCLTALDRYQLQQVSPPVLSDPAPAA